MTAMIFLRTQFLRPVAMTLAACLIWLGIACISLCALHSEETEQEHVSLSIGDAAIDEDCCPVSDAVGSMLPERLTIQPLSSDAQPVALTSLLLSSIKPFEPESLALAASPSPPFRRLSVLRI
jgi:hypothetical protein